MKKRYFLIGGILLALCVVLFSVWYCFMEPYLLELDYKANQEFAEKASRLQIKGKPKAYVITHFGKPDYSVQDGYYETLVYIPGPVLLIWNGECRIGIDRRTGLVKGWVVNQ